MAETTPLQDDKKAKIDELTGAADTAESKEETRGVKPGTKRGPYRKKGKKAAPKKSAKKPEPEPEVSPYTDEDAERDAAFMTEFVNHLRTQAGIDPISPTHAMFLNASSKQMFLKYGATTSKWMPEIMFGGTILMIGVDTAQRLREKRAQVKNASKDTQKAKKPENEPTGAPQRDEKGRFQKPKKDSRFKDGKQQANLSLQ